jgi:hypothetical protein
MSPSRLARLTPLAGVVFAVIFYVAIFGFGDTPSANDKTAKVVKFWSDNDSKQIAVAIMAVIATVFFVWFAGAVRERLVTAEAGSGRRSTTVYAGAMLYAVGLLISAGLTFTVADTAGDVPPTVTQSLSVLEEDFFFPFVGGLAVLYLGTAAAVLTTGGLPRWIGWVSLVLGVVCLTPVGWVPFLLSGLWAAVVGIVVYRAGAPGPVAEAEATPSPVERPVVATRP